MLSMRKIILNGIIAITTFISAGVVCGNESQTFLNTSGHNERSQLDTELSNSTYQTVIVKILANSSNDVANHKNLRLLQYDEDEEKNPVFNDTVAGTSAEVATNNSEVAVIKDGDRKVEDISEKFHVKRSVDIKSADEWLHHPSTEGYSTVKDDGAGGIDRRLSIGAENRPGSKFVANGKFSSKRIWTLWENNPSAFQAKMRYLIRLKTRIKHHLLHRVPTKENKNSLPDELIKIFHKLINQSESLIVVSVHHFDRALTVGYGSIELIKKNCEDRLQTLRELLIEEDRLLNNIVNLQKLSEQSLAKQNMTQLSNFWYSIMENIKEAADDLESELADPAFDTMLKSGNKPNVETVIKVHDGNSEMDKRNAEAGHGSDESFQEDYLRLVDSQNNQYVMSKSRDTTVPTEDASLVKDIINVILASSVFVLMCRICGLPVMFGYILTGVILGPAGFNLIKNLVQMETLGEFGVFFILFSVGLEFSLEKLRRVS
ncbi:TMCO3 (predicted) [Pycnogonum litorale]